MSMSDAEARELDNKDIPPTPEGWEGSREDFIRAYWQYYGPPFWEAVAAGMEEETRS